MATFKDLTNYFQQIGAVDVGHTGKSYLAHVIAVYNDLKSWGAGEDVARGGMFHSIYGTERFQGFKLPFERRPEVQDLIGERAEYLAWLNCVIDRTAFDQECVRNVGPYEILNRVSGQRMSVTDTDFHDLSMIHLVDWLEQVERSGDWHYRRAAYHRLAETLGEHAVSAYESTYAGH